MKKLALVLLLVAACRSGGRQQSSQPGSANGGGTGAETPRAAVDAFLRAIRSEDLQALGAVWGTKDGAARELMDRNELERREILMVCFFRHDAFRVLNEGPSTAGKRIFEVELARGQQRRSTSFVTVPGRQGRWYVEDAKTEPVKDWCARKP